MPYSSNDELPDAVRNSLPPGAQSRFRHTVNSALERGLSEERAHRTGWHVVGQGWRKPKDGGKWVRKATLFNGALIELQKGNPEFNPDQPRDNSGRWAGGSGGGEGVAARTTRAPRAPRTRGGGKKSLKEMAKLLRQAKVERSKLRQRIRGAQTRLNSLKRSSPQYRSLAAKIRGMKKQRAEITRAMGDLAKAIARRRGGREIDWVLSAMAGTPRLRAGTSFVESTATKSSNGLDKGYPEYDPDQPRGNDGKWTRGGGGGRAKPKPERKPRASAKPKKPPTRKPRAAPKPKPKPPTRKPPAKKPPPKKPTERKPRAPRKPPTEKPPVQRDDVDRLTARDRGELERAYTRYDWLQGRIDDARAQQDILSNEIADLQGKYDALPRFDRVSSPGIRLADQINASRARFATLAGQLKSYEEQRASTRTSIENLERRLRGQKKRFVGKHRMLKQERILAVRRSMRFLKRRTDAGASIPCTLLKADKDLGLIFGWAIICDEEGEPYFDTQGDHIPQDAMLEAAAEFMEKRRTLKIMHAGKKVGTVLFAWPMTEEIGKAMGIDAKRTGLMIGVKPDKRTVLERFRTGQYTGFSIGGNRIVDELVD